MRIFTIGYGGRKRSEFIDLLKNNEVQIVVDVRLKPEYASLGIPSQNMRHWSTKIKSTKKQGD